MKFEYPNARETETVEDFHGQKVDNKYDWMEDPDAEETKCFNEAQNKITRDFLDQFGKRDQLKAKFETINDYEKYGIPFRGSSEDGYWYFYHNSGLQNQYVLYQTNVDKPDINADGCKAILDPNSMASDGTVSCKQVKFSPDGSTLAYNKSISGSDWSEMHFLSTKYSDASKSFEHLPNDVLKRVKYSGTAWSKDGKGVFYACYPQQEGKTDGTETTAAHGQKIHYHRIGTNQSQDQLVYENIEEPEWMFGVSCSQDGRYLFLEVQKGCERTNMLYCAQLGEDKSIPQEKISWKAIVDEFKWQYSPIWNVGNICYLQTDENASNQKVIKVDLDQKSFPRDKPLGIDHISEHEDNVLSDVAVCDMKYFITNYMVDCKDKVRVFDIESGNFSHDIEFPDMGSIGWSCRKYMSDIYFKLTGWVNPGAVYKYNIHNEKIETIHQTIVSGFDASKYKTNQVFYPSKDGTKIPMFIISKKDIEMNSDNPTVLYAYGGFNIPITPYFSAYKTVWSGDLNGVLAIANIRGGGEYGKKWYDGGKLMNKMNCFDDFNAGAEYLIDNKYTSSKKLAIEGGSNGGTLVAACFNQRPELYRAVLCHVPVIDMYRFHKYTIGHAWKSDYGDPEEKIEDFEYNKQYSPLHNVKLQDDKSVPGMMILTADHDDRVVPHHSLKFAAEVQKVHGKTSENPLLLRVDIKAGHGGGKPTAMVIEEQVDKYGFLALMMGLEL